MATLKSSADGREIEVRDGDPLADAAEELDVTFRCRGGGCGACKTRIVEGLENLSPPSKNELRYARNEGMEPDERLMCQTKIEGGCVSIVVQEPKYDSLGRLRLPAAETVPGYPGDFVGVGG